MMLRFKIDIEPINVGSWRKPTFILLISFSFISFYSSYNRYYCDWWYCHQVRCYWPILLYCIIKMYGQIL